MSLPQFGFTSEDVQDWQNALYALPDWMVEEEADAAEADFAGWLPTRFRMDPEQISFLNGIEPDILAHWGNSTAFFITHGLPIILIKPEGNPSPAARSRKRVTSKDVTETPQAATVKSDAPSNCLVFEISY